MARKQLSKKLRFEIFKRDEFTCAYCGATPPSVTLEVDHIIPVSSGGESTEDNLITSCFDCNRGKGKNGLDAKSRPLAVKAAEVAEKEEQLKEYRKELRKRERRIERDVDAIDEVFQEYNPGYCMSDSARRSVKRFLEHLDPNQIKDNLDLAYHARRARDPFPYFCGICWRMIKGD